MGIAGQVIQELKLAEDGEVGSGAESAPELGQGRDFVAQQVLAKVLGAFDITATDGLRYPIED